MLILEYYQDQINSIYRKGGAIRVKYNLDKSIELDQSLIHDTLQSKKMCYGIMIRHVFDGPYSKPLMTDIVSDKSFDSD